MFSKPVIASRVLDIRNIQFDNVGGEMIAPFMYPGPDGTLYPYHFVATDLILRGVNDPGYFESREYYDIIHDRIMDAKEAMRMTQLKDNKYMRKVCASCWKHKRRAKKCSACKCTWYCNTECQRTHWKFHKRVCVQQRVSTHGDDKNDKKIP